MKQIPVTVFTGYLGSGKTTIILNLIKQLPKGYTVVMLKNEFGNMAVDSELARASNIGVKEYLNGCLCCVLIGKLGNALEELLDQYKPDHIIIETSGSAYPGPIAWEIRKIDRLRLDGLITVIDAINFEGYKDKSYTAKLQTKDTDLILINKHEKVDERTLDTVLDDVYELNPQTPKVRTDRGTIDPDLIFGLDTKLFERLEDVTFETRNKDEHHHTHEVETLEMTFDQTFNKVKFEQFLGSLAGPDFYRIKGIIQFQDGFSVVNYVFGKWTIEPILYKGKSKLVFMGPLVKSYSEMIYRELDCTLNGIT